VSSPKQREDFNTLLVECIHETIVTLLSLQVAEALYKRLETNYSISKDEIPYRLEALLSTLKNTFGASAKILEKAIAKKFYSRLGLDFSNAPQRTLIDYVEQAKLTLQSRSASTEK
jgi:hypothetical protein